MDKRKELELLMLEKEKRRRESAKRSGEVHEALKEQASSVIEDAPILAAQGATLGFADELYGKANELVGGDYEQSRDMIRKKTQEARERHPFAAPAIETVAGLPAMAAFPSGVVGTAMGAATMGVGESEESTPFGVGVDAAVTGLTGAAVHGGFKGAKRLVSGGESILGRFMGKGAKDFEKRGGRLGDPRQTAKELKDAGFFKYKVADLDVNEGKFKPVKKIGRGKPTREDALINADNAIKKIGDEVNLVLEKKPLKENYVAEDFIYHPDLVQSTDDIINSSTNEKKTREIVDEELKNLRYSLNNPIEVEDMFGDIVSEPQGVNLKRINQIKQNFQRESKKNYEAVEPIFKEKAAIQERIANALKTFVEDQIHPSERANIKRLNRLSHQLHNAKDSLSKAVAKREAGGVDTSVIKPYANTAYIAENALEKLGGGDKGMLTRADIAGKLESIPEGIRRPVRRAVKDYPTRLASDYFMHDDNDLSKLPEKLVKTTVPRTTQGILDNLDFVKMKLAQQAPQFYETFMDVVENNPQQLDQLLPWVEMRMPHIFDYDKYNRINGKIHDEQMKVKARKDVMHDDNLSNIEKAKIIQKLNKTGEFDYDR